MICGLGPTTILLNLTYLTPLYPSCNVMFLHFEYTTLVLNKQIKNLGNFLNEKLQSN